jgi:hypothetical protein
MKLVITDRRQRSRTPYLTTADLSPGDVFEFVTPLHHTEAGPLMRVHGAAPLALSLRNGTPVFPIVPNGQVSLLKAELTVIGSGS